MAPWLLLGMFLSGLLHVLLPKGFIRRKFHGIGGIFKAVLLGVPLPLCSCGVVPAGIGIKNQGASDGASVGFLISTPQTGVDSILVASSFFGWPFALFKMLAAAITGIIGGVVADQLPKANADESLHVLDGDRATAESRHPAWLELWLHGLEIVRSIWGWLLIGIVISAVIELYMPDAWIVAIGDWGLFTAMLLVLLISTPLYVCATASVPIAAALVETGLPPAAALVFLMAGPATNVTTIGAITSRFGWRTAATYLTTIVVGSMLAAWLFDGLVISTITGTATHVHDYQSLWAVGSGSILLGMIAWFIYSDFRLWLRRWTQHVDLGTEMEVQVAGMTCGGCVKKLESALQSSGKTQSVMVQLSPGIARVSGEISRAAVEAIIENAGFRVVKVDQQTLPN